MTDERISDLADIGGTPDSDDTFPMLDDSAGATRRTRFGDLVEAPLADHVGAADPHTGYQKESEKDAASGYPSLDGGGKVPLAELPTGTTAASVALGNAPAAGITTHEAAADPHVGYLLESLFDAKGDLITASADNTPIRKAIGATDGMALLVDAASAGGMKWDAPPFGAWTPDVTFATPGDFARTWTIQSGNYWRFGRLVIAWFDLSSSAWTWTTATGVLRINGLPFTANNSNPHGHGSIYMAGWTHAGYHSLIPDVINNQTYFQVLAMASALAANTYIVAADMPSGTQQRLRGFVAYYTA